MDLDEVVTTAQMEARNARGGQHEKGRVLEQVARDAGTPMGKPKSMDIHAADALARPLLRLPEAD
jgi:hypothetical protein